MAKKYLKFTKCEDNHFVVMSGKIALGCVEVMGQVFKKRAVFQESVDSTEYTSECLRQIADKLDSLEGVVSPSTSDNNDSQKCLTCFYHGCLRHQDDFEKGGCSEWSSMVE